MAVEHFEIHTCDRCEKKLEINARKNSEAIWSWGCFWFGQNNGPIYTKINRLPTTASQYTELCEECIIDLNRWFTHGKK